MMIYEYMMTVGGKLLSNWAMNTTEYNGGLESLTMAQDANSQLFLTTIVVDICG